MRFLWNKRRSAVLNNPAVREWASLAETVPSDETSLDELLEELALWKSRCATLIRAWLGEADPKQESH